MRFWATTRQGDYGFMDEGEACRDSPAAIDTILSMNVLRNVRASFFSEEHDYSPYDFLIVKARS
jgi:hypothetical protein